jgi:hypothetical protein
MKFLVAVALATVASVQAGCFPEGVRPPTLSYEEKVREELERFIPFCCDLWKKISS